MSRTFSASKIYNLQRSLFYYVRSQNVSHSATAAVKQAQQSLPQLPVPKLQHTLNKYLQTVEPFLTKQEYASTKEIVRKFGADNGIGAQLQRLLVERAKTTENWLSDWWLNAAYLEYRDPVVVFSSPGLVFPFENFSNEDDRLEYTTKLILAAVDYKLLIDRDGIPLDKMGKDPLDMNQYKKVFGTCRIPAAKRDQLEFNADSKHVVVVNNNHYFKLPIITDDGAVLSEKQVMDQLYEILQQSSDLAPGVGVLTTENRDNWASAYQELIKDENNKRSANEIQQSLFLVCLDNPMPVFETESRQTTASKQFIHGGGSCGNAANRWFDKTIQFVIGQDGTVGLTYEHSPSEGQPIAVMTDYLVNYIKNNASKDIPNAGGATKVEKLEFNVNDNLQKAIDVANINIDKLVEDLDMDCFTFKSFGKDFVKTQKLSPDSFIQMAMQYAFYRIHKVPGAHYESAATRKYIHGRTETIRSCSNESVLFAQAMLDSGKSDADKIRALKAAIDSHKKYSIEAVNGFGVDRHLLGLKLIALENKIKLPELYEDVAFARSTHMRISSSQVATKCDGFMCYGPLVKDGYGCCYNPRPNDINFAVSAFVSHPETSAEKYREALEKSLMDMHNVLAKAQQSKL